MTLGEKIKSLRLAKGMTQTQLAKALDVYEANIVSYEKDRTYPRRRGTLERMAEVLDCDVEYLQGLIDTPRKPHAESEPEPQPVAETQPVTEPAAEPQPEPVAETEPAAETQPEPQPAAETVPAAEPVAEPQPAAETAAEAEPVQSSENNEDSESAENSENIEYLYAPIALTYGHHCITYMELEDKARQVLVSLGGDPSEKMDIWFDPQQGMARVSAGGLSGTFSMYHVIGRTL